jgi:predicted oxidoreductase (fatty acid repression mutant protein)
LDELVHRTSKLSLIMNVFLYLSHIAEVPHALANMVNESPQSPNHQSANHDSKHNVDLGEKQGGLGIVDQVSKILSFEISGQVHESCSSLLERVKAAVQVLFHSDEEVVSFLAENHRNNDPIPGPSGSKSCNVAGVRVKVVSAIS